MNKRKFVLLFFLLAPSISDAQFIDSTYAKFEKTESYKVVYEYLKKKDHVNFSSDDRKITGTQLILFVNILNNQKYIESDYGVWKVGACSSEPIFFLYFKYNGKVFFESANYDKVIKRINHFCKVIKLSEKDYLLYLFGIVKYLNECYGYPIECIVEDCYSPPVD
ncbi:MAG: hypothetical protein AB7V36_14020 [Bacteroidales bacterium]